MSPTTENVAKHMAQEGNTLFLSETLGDHVVVAGKRVGRLVDLVVIETGRLPEVSHLVVSRPFGYPALLIPWEKVLSITTEEAVIEPDDITKYEGVPPPDSVLLNDHILDKKVLDVEGREVEVVYDIKMVMIGKKLYVTEADLSRYGLLRRIGLKRLADFIYRLADKIQAQTISWTYLQPLPSKLSSFRGNVKLKVLRERIKDMPPVDLADILEELDHDHRLALFNELPADRASDTLEEIDPSVQRSIVLSLDKDKVASLISAMTPAQAADLLSSLPWSEVRRILNFLGHDTVTKIRAILNHQDENILNLGTMRFLKFAPEETVHDAAEAYRQRAKGMDVVMYLYILNGDSHLLGVIDIKELLQASGDVLLKDIMTKNIVSLNPDSKLKEASDLFERYGFRAIPITDSTDKILGVIPYRDIMKLGHHFLE